MAKRIKLDSAEFERNLKKLVKGGFVNGHIENDVYVFGENVVAKDKMVELFAELQEAEVIFTDMRNHLTQREEERDAMFNIAKIFQSGCKHPDADVRAMFDKPNATFKGDHKKYDGSPNGTQPSNEEDTLSK